MRPAPEHSASPSRERTSVPQVARGIRRVVTAGALAAVALAVIGVAGERLRFGPDLAGARARIEADVRQQVAVATARLDGAVALIEGAADAGPALDRRDAAGARLLFSILERATPALGTEHGALTLYSPDAQPVAWTGRPATLPIDRILGPDALFLARSPLGLRLTRVMPMAPADGGDGRRGSIVAETPLPRAAGDDGRGDGFLVDTSVVAVAVRPGFEGVATPDAAVIRTPDDQPLALVEMPAAVIDGARARWRTAVIAAEGLLVALVAVMLCGPVVTWRRGLRTVTGHLVATATAAGLIVGARWVAWVALPSVGLALPPLATPPPNGPSRLFLASPVDFVLSALALAGLVALASSSFEHWRHYRRRLPKASVAAWRTSWLVFALAQAAGGAVTGLVIARYEDVLRARLALMPYDLLHFSLQSLDPARLLVGMGFVILHAAIIAFVVLVLRTAVAPWVVTRRVWWGRAAVPVLWFVPALGAAWLWMRQWEDPPLWPTAIVLLLGIVAAWRFRRARAALEHASQAARLIAFGLALLVPALAFYPSLVDAAGRARRQAVTHRYAPEVVNQRRDLQRQLSDALSQIDSAVDLPELLRAGAAGPRTPLPTDAAFLVWSRTVLANQRATSVELYDAVGTLVSRFALELPQPSGAPAYQEAGCEWELFEEVSPFFAEDRILLHAGRGICVDGPGGRRDVIGSVVVHVTLDYGNLSFISGQSPYVAALRRSRGEVAPATTPHAVVEFTAYGWSRRPLYMSGRDAWPLTEAVFQQAYASREPFWAAATRGEVTYDVFVLNDRAAIYALGYPRVSWFGHVISLAEIVALVVITYLALQLAWALYGSLIARTPGSARAFLREVRASFYRKLFIAFVAAAVVPVLALAFVTRNYITDLMQADLEMEATRTAASASRVVEDVGTLEASGAAPTAIGDDLVVWLSRVIAQGVNIFDGSGLLASSERNLFASGLLPTRTQGEIYRAIVLEGRPAFVGRETVAGYSYLVAAAPVRVRNQDAILTVPLTLRQQEIDAQIEELDRRVLLAVLLFIMLGAAIGYSMAERIADPVNRLTRATGRIARGDLDARILATSTDEFRRLLDAFNSMAADLQRQRAELERTNRLAAWADMARQVAHDIKNPLTPIQLNAEHLQRVHADRGGPLGRVLDECVHNILTQVRLLRQIASEFSNFASSPTVRPAPTDLAALLAEVVDPYRPGLAGRIIIEVHVAEALPPLLVDKAVLARALTNVIENALHAMPGAGSLTLTATRVDATRVELAIADTGVGMDRAALDRIFEPYFSTKASGTGLGLTIAKRNVELNGGTIAVASERGRGTEVRLVLPIAD